MVNLNRQYRRQVLLLLSLIFVLQGIFPLAAHTQLARDNQGRLVQICTLEGTKSYRLDNGNPLGEDQSSDTYRSAAIEFSGLLVEIVLATPEPFVISVEFVSHERHNSLRQ